MIRKGHSDEGRYRKRDMKSEESTNDNEVRSEEKTDEKGARGEEN